MNLTSTNLENYLDYFKKHREDYSLLKDIPPYEYFKESKQIVKHPLSNYSLLNIVLIGNFIAELFKKYENKEVESYIYVENKNSERIKHHYTLEKVEEKPYVIIGNISNDRFYNPLQDEENIIIPFEDGYRRLNFEGYIRGNTLYFNYASVDEVASYYSPKRYLILGNEELEKIDYKKYEFIRDLIYSLIYYKKENGIIDVDDEHLRGAYKKIFKI